MSRFSCGQAIWTSISPTEVPGANPNALGLSVTARSHCGTSSQAVRVAVMAGSVGDTSPPTATARIAARHSSGALAAGAGTSREPTVVLAAVGVTARGVLVVGAVVAEGVGGDVVAGCPVAHPVTRRTAVRARDRRIMRHNVAAGLCRGYGRRYTIIPQGIQLRSNDDSATHPNRQGPRPLHVNAEATGRALFAAMDASEEESGQAVPCQRTWPGADPWTSDDTADSNKLPSCAVPSAPSRSAICAWSTPVERGRHGAFGAGASVDRAVRKYPLRNKNGDRHGMASQVRRHWLWSES